MNLIEKLTAAQTELAEVKAAVESGEKSAEDLNAAIENVKTAQANVDAAEEAENLIKSLTPAEEQADTEDKKVEYKNLGEYVAANVSDIDVKEKFTKTISMFKAAAPMVTPSSIAPAITDVDKRIVEGYRRPLMIADLFSAERIAGGAITFFVESSSVEGGPAYTTEGSAKPLMSFGDPVPKTVALAKIASYMKESDELIEDAPWLADAINGRGMYQHELAIENYLVTTLSGTSGIGTANKLTPEGIFRAMTTVQTNSGFAADAIVINPLDYQELRLRKDANNQYYGGGYFYQQYAQGGVVEQPSLWGLRTVVTPAVAQGTAFVGAFKIGGSVVHKNSGVSVTIANQNEDDFIKNMVTILIEERLALAVRRPAAFVKITGSSTSTDF